MHKISSQTEYEAAIGGGGLVVAVFKADWCKDCRFIEPFMPEVVEKYRDKIRFVEVDRDELPDLCVELNILGIPSFVAYRDGKELIRFVSKLRKTREEIEQFLDRAIAVGESLQS